MDGIYITRPSQQSSIVKNNNIENNAEHENIENIERINTKNNLM